MEFDVVAKVSIIELNVNDNISRYIAKKRYHHGVHRKIYIWGKTYPCFQYSQIYQVNDMGSFSNADSPASHINLSMFHIHKYLLYNDNSSVPILKIQNDIPGCNDNSKDYGRFDFDIGTILEEFPFNIKSSLADCDSVTP
jgi:hypothetical protein